jgi:hypothetical protein
LHAICGSKIPPDLFAIFRALQLSGELELHIKNDWKLMKKILYMYHAFKEKHNRIPGIFPNLIIIIQELNTDLILDEFHVKSMRYALGLHEVPDLQNRIFLSLICRDKIFDVVKKLKRRGHDISAFVQGMPKRVPFRNKDLEQWIVKHSGISNVRLIHDVVSLWDEEGFPRKASIQEMKHFIEKSRADLEWNMCLKKYPDAIKPPFSCTIIKTSVQIGADIARMLEPNDKMQVLLGSFTVCCQKLNASGEASMMEGLLNPDSGFLVFERNKVIIAQAWIWLSEDRKQLVLDNIELADGKNIDDIFLLLKTWVRRAPYSDIQLGLGHSKIVFGEKVLQRDMKWFKQHWIQRYTDANSRIWLKKSGFLRI